MPKDNELYDELFDHPAYKLGYEIGTSFGEYETSKAAINAYKNGEIDLWIKYMTPKTIEEWEEFYAKHGDLSNKWKDAKNYD